MAYSSITKPSEQFNTLLWTGDGTSSRDITGAGFQPDFTWIKDRDGTFYHILSNSTSGDNKFLTSNSNAAESTDSTKFRTFVSDGIQVGNHNGVNASSNKYVAWNWKGNGGTEVSNTDGSITSNVQVNSTNGFSIVRYTGTGSAATVGHGLGSTPDLVISKNTSAGDWNVYHESFALNERIKLNSTGAKNTNTSIFAALPTSTTISIGTGGDINTNGNTHYFWCYKNVKGFSKIGSYTGNGNADGAFIYTGFKPAFGLVKQSSAAGENWFICDSKREGYNAENNRLLPDANSAESTDSPIDILSNGFKARQSGAAVNGSGATYIYAAFAEHPLVANVSGGLPATAR